MGLSERTVAKGATRMAWRLRGNWLAELFLGRRGLAGWLKAVGLFLLLTVVAAALGSFVFLLWLLTVVVLVVSLTRAVSPTKAGALVTRVSLAVWIFGTIYTVASFSVAIDAIDANVERPWWTALAGAPAIAISLMGFVGFVTSLAFSASRRTRSS